MANRIIAYVPDQNLSKLNSSQVQQLLDLMTPALNVIAGEVVFWNHSPGHWMALASLKRDEP